MTKIKICGITKIEDAMAAAEAGVDYLGFILYPRSPRYVRPESVREMVLAVRAVAPQIRFAGVFVNEPPTKIRTIVEDCELDLVQLHGEEPPRLVREFSSVAYKSLRPRDQHEARTLLSSYGASLRNNRPAFIVDAFSDTLFGGTGDRADWRIARSISVEFPIFLAGGLSPENVSEAIRAAQPWGVDVSSGVERAAGLKDHAKMKRFVDTVRAVEVQ